MKAPQLKRLLLSLQACLLLFAASLHAARPAQPTPPAAGEPPLRLREIYVPESLFRALTEKDDQGIVMTLAEYRTLVHRALSRIKPKQPDPELPPLAAAVQTARYTGRLHGNAVRLQAELTIRTTRDGWVRCPLGRPLPNLGRIVVNDQPGWMLLTQSGKQAELLLKGAREHHVVLFYSLPVKEHEDRFSLQGPVIPAAGARMVLDIPDQVAAQSRTGFLETVHGKGTSLRLALGASNTINIEWKQKKTSGQKDGFLAAKHWMRYAVRPDYPSFNWIARITVARQKTDTLLFREAPGTRMLELTGPLVHSWERTDKGLQVLLKEAVLGAVTLTGGGIIEKPADNYVLGVLSLNNAHSQTGYMALYEPGRQALKVTAQTRVTEAAAQEAQAPAVLNPKEGAGTQVRLSRQFAFTDSDAQVTVALASRSIAVETHGTYIARISEEKAFLDGVVRIAVTEGRLYNLDMTVARPWRIVMVKELVRKNIPGHNAVQDINETDDGTALSLIFGRAVTPGQPVEFQMRLVLDQIAPDNLPWDTQSLAIHLPIPVDIPRNRFDLGIVLPDSMDAMMGDLPEWRPLAPAVAQRLGMPNPAPGSGRQLVAALTTRHDTGKLTMTLAHRPPRGEYCAVTHVMALERRIRVRTDIRMTAVDRPIDALLFNLPLSADTTVVVLGPGIKEIQTDLDRQVKTVFFTAPWLGTRQFRVEYEHPLTPETDIPVPVLGITTPLAKDYFGSERFLVLQSKGPVEIKLPESGGLKTVDMDDLPDFTESWPKGRVLTAYRFRDAQTPGTIRTTLHERAPVLRRLAREMNLTTMLGKDGRSRTRAEILLAYDQDQSFSVQLWNNARCLAVTVNGDPIRSVIESQHVSQSGARTITIPLPPQSYATVSITYEQTNAERDAFPDGYNPGVIQDLGAYGTWQSIPPRLLDIPVGNLTWAIHHPEGYVMKVRRDSPIRGTEKQFQQHQGLFVETFFAPLFSGSMPVFTVFQSPAASGQWVSPPDKITKEEALGALETETRQADNRLKAVEQRQAAQGSHGHHGAPLFTLLPEGRRIQASKLGGGGHIMLTYVSEAWCSFARSTVFALVVFAGCLLACRGRRKCFWTLVTGGLFLGTLIPYIFQFMSPLLIVPACEGLMVLLILGALWGLIRRMVALIRGEHIEDHECEPVPEPKVIGRAQVTCLLLCLTALFVGAVEGADPADEAKALLQSGVLIPYPDDTVPPDQFPEAGKAYMPYKKFLALYRLAWPEDEKPAAEKPPAAMVLGNAEYHLTVQGDRCQINGTIIINVLTDKWVTVPLPFSRTQLVSVQLDGKTAGIAQKSVRAGKGSTVIPFIEMKGKGQHTLSLTLTAPILRKPGEYRILSGIMADASASLEATLPAGADISLFTGAQTPAPREKHPAIVTAEQDQTIIKADIGHAGRIELAWTFPKIEGQKGAQVESLSFTHLPLTPAGYGIERFERIRITGRKVDQLTYVMAGDWRITDVTGNDVSEWSTGREADGADRRLLQIFFAQPVSQANLLILGQTILKDAGPLATLTLKDAVKQETFIGLTHAPLRRFSTKVLSGCRRASRSDLAQHFALPARIKPHRFYHCYGSGEGEQLAAEPIDTDITLATDGIIAVSPDRLAVSTRVRYQVKGAGPLQYAVTIPQDWIVRTVQSDILRDWRVMPGDDGQTLVVHFSRRAATGTSLVWSCERHFDEPPEAITVPPLSADRTGPGRMTENTRWAFAANEELKLTVRQAGNRVPVALDQIPKWLTLPDRMTYRFGLRTPRNGSDAPVTVAAEKQAGQLTASHIAFVRVAEDFIHINARLIYQVRRAGRDTFRFTLPAGAELVHLETRNQQSRTVAAKPEGTAITIMLQSKKSGMHAVDVSYRIPRVENQTMHIRPIVSYDGDQVLKNIDQYVGILQTASTFISETGTAGLVAIDPETMPFLPEGVSAANLQPTFRASRLDWQLSLTEEEIEIVEGPAAMIELAELTTVVGTDGTARTRVVYTVTNRNLQFLVLSLPARAHLWGVTLNGKAVAVGASRNEAPEQQGAQVLRIPVEYVGAASLNLEVAVQYAEPMLALPALKGRETLAAPKVHDTKVKETIWNVFFPKGYALTMAGGNMREVPSSTQYAKKVENLLGQYEKIVKTAGEADSRRVQDQAQQEMIRLEQVLGDNLAELQVQNRSVGEMAQSTRVGQQSLETQWALNDDLIEESQKVQRALQTARQAQQRKTTRSSSRTRKEQAFIDRDNFLGNAWRGGKRSQQAVRPKAPPAQSKGKDMTLDRLTGDLDFDGLQKIAGQLKAGAAIAPQQVQPEGFDKKKGLKALPETLTAENAPGLEASPETWGTVGYTFFRSEGNAEITISYIQDNAMHRLGAMAALLLLPLAFLWLKRKKGAVVDAD